MSDKPKVIAVVGPTASGKTSLSIELAKSFNGEVISADSRQVYRGLDIGSGKVTKEEMENIPHHLLDVVEPMTIYTGADFKRDATVAITDILGRQKTPIIAGGTFFYVELLRGTMQPAPVEPNYAYRQSLESYSDEELLKMLKEKDVVRASNIDPHNRRRLIRALEIINAIGEVPPVRRTESPYDWLIIGITYPKEELHQRIHHRLNERFVSGMVEEVEHLLKSGITPARLDELGLEYRYISRFLLGEMTESAMKKELETKIRQFAKRQLTWLKRDGAIEWFNPQDYQVIFERVRGFLK
jgi:tRNA dimethylallyltransferase